MMLNIARVADIPAALLRLLFRRAAFAKTSAGFLA